MDSNDDELEIYNDKRNYDNFNNSAKRLDKMLKELGT